MSSTMPEVPAGNGRHPIQLVVVAANDLEASTAFYADVMGCRVIPMGPGLTALAPAAGPGVALRADTPEGFPGVVPFIGVPDVAEALAKVVGAGATVERAPWNVPSFGALARFADASGTLWGLTSAAASSVERVPMPFGANPKPAPGTVCSLEMYAADGEAAGRFFGEQFGWGWAATMPSFVAFDPGAGIGGVYQSHTSTLPAVAYLYVEDVAASIARIEELGGRRDGDPTSMPGMATFGYFQDPSGTTMGLIGPA